eukprot:scaffold25796_cov39-Phaeocystis_antarctica.AAC.1
MSRAGLPVTFHARVGTAVAHRRRGRRGRWRRRRRRWRSWRGRRRLGAGRQRRRRLQGRRAVLAAVISYRPLGSGSVRKTSVWYIVAHSPQAGAVEFGAIEVSFPVAIRARAGRAVVPFEL